VDCGPDRGLATLVVMTNGGLAVYLALEMSGEKILTLWLVRGNMRDLLSRCRERPVHARHSYKGPFPVSRWEAEEWDPERVRAFNMKPLLRPRLQGI